MKSGLVYGIPNGCTEIMLVRRIRLPQTVSQKDLEQLKLEIESILGFKIVAIEVE